MSSFKVAGAFLLACLLVAVSSGTAIAGEKRPTVRVVTLAVENGTVVGPDVKNTPGIGWVRIEQGEIVELHWTTDEHIALQVHGYNLGTKLRRGGQTKMRMRAELTGRFPVRIKTLVAAVQQDAEEGKAEQPSQNRMLFYLDIRERQTASN